ncbi:MAG: hypothetical protein A2Y24_06720 [Clostridiales bacterium GWE2_32_10]|nr:MAG: hypothetical protein A2Y24_06720 [Clostridiales bacterium GWE2_32_10]
MKKQMRMKSFLLVVVYIFTMLAGIIPPTQALADTAGVQFTKIAAGGNHTVALKSDGTVWTWGANANGQLGDGTTVNRGRPAQVSGLSGITEIAGGNSYTIALKNDGTVWTWGYNYYGQLGDGTTTQRKTPVQVSGLSGIIAIAGGEKHTIALKNDGTVWTWGDNSYGQLGDDTTTQRNTPAQVSGLSGIIAIAGGGNHTIVLKNDGTVWTWGYNSWGQLGDGTTTQRNTPVQISGLSGVVAIAGGMYHTIALKNDGTVWAWGYNSGGQLGDGTTTQRKIPVQVNGLSGITVIAGGMYHTIALKNDGTVWAWGDNRNSQLGDGTITSRNTPIQISGLNEITVISAGGFHTIALKNDGTIWTWGYNNYGQLGYISAFEKVPVQVSGLSGIIAISGGGSHTIALKNDGTVWAWGYNNYGQIGDGTTAQRKVPVQISGLSGITEIATGSVHTIALKNDGTVWVWGYNNYGQLGDGTTTQRNAPVQVNGLSGITAISGGAHHTIALKNDGTVYAWGRNYYGQLGDGTTTNRIVPVQVSGLSGITEIEGGNSHTIAGTQWAWGYNSMGQLGDGTTTFQKNVPAQISGFSGMTTVVAGGYHTIALKSDGTIWTWGYNNYGQLGDGSITNRNVPVQVSQLSEMAVIAGGIYYTIVLKNDGTVWTWGYNDNGQLGNGICGNINYLKQITNSAPETTIVSPQSNQLFTENDTILQPQIRVVDVDDDTLSCKYYIDSETTARENKNIMNTEFSQDVIFNSINISTISDGIHSIKYEISDGMTTPVTQTLNFKVDKLAPTITNFSPTSSASSIMIAGGATDGVAGLDINPYRYTMDGVVSSWTDATSYTVSSLSPNQPYTVRFEAKDTVGHIASQTQTIYTQAQVPPINISNVTENSLTVNISDENPAGTQYQIKTGSSYVTQDGTLTTTPTWVTLDSKSITVIGLISNTTYTFDVVARNGDGIITQSSSATDITRIVLPTIPTDLTYTSTTNSVSISWPPVDGAVTYSIDIDNGTTIVNDYPFTSYTHEGLSPGAEHTYKVKATNTAGSSDWSMPIVAVTALDAPTNVTATSTSTNMTLSWSPVTNATGYDVEVDGVVTSTANTTATISGLVTSTEHTYRVRAKNDITTSEWSTQNDKLTRITPPTAPTNVTASEKVSSITLTWDAVSTATTYQVSVDGNVINSGSDPIYVDTGLTPGTEHIYMVRAVNSGGKSAWSNVITVSTKTIDVNAPSNLTATITSLNLTWGAVENATAYDLNIEQANVDGTKTIQEVTVTNPNYTVTNLTAGTVVIYKVRSTIGGVSSSWSQSVTVIVGGNVAEKPQNITAVPTNTSVSLSWDKVTGATSYEIEKNGSIIGSSRGLTFVNEGLTPNTQVTYRVRAMNSTGVGEWSSPVNTTTLANQPLNIPGNIIATPTMNTISLIWDTVDGATGYDLEIDSTTIQNVTGNTYTLSGLNSQTQHSFKVRAKNDSTAGNWSGVITSTTLETNQVVPQGEASTSYTANVSLNEEFTLVLSASDIQNLSTVNFTITYDPSLLDVVDLCTTTAELDTTMGDISNTELNVTEPAQGTLVYKITTPIAQGQSFTGFVDSIRFKAKVTGPVTVNYVVN